MRKNEWRELKWEGVIDLWGGFNRMLEFPEKSLFYRGNRWTMLVKWPFGRNTASMEKH